MKRYFSLIVFVVALLSFSAVFAVKAEETTAENLNSNTTSSVTEQKPVEPELSKIPSPDKIQYYREVKKIGDSLYGILIKGINQIQEKKNNTTTKPTESNNTTDTKSTTTNTDVVKIPSPAYIQYFREVKKVGNSLYGRLKEGVDSAISKKLAPKARPVVTSEQSACVISAINEKDQAVITARTVEMNDFTTAVKARGTCQSAALLKVDGQSQALELCVKDFRKTMEVSRTTLKKAHDEAWKTYTTSLKACGKSSTDTNQTSSSEIMVEDGGNE